MDWSTLQCGHIHISVADSLAVLIDQDHSRYQSRYTSAKVRGMLMPSCRLHGEELGVPKSQRSPLLELVVCLVIPSNGGPSLAGQVDLYLGTCQGGGTTNQQQVGQTLLNSQSHTVPKCLYMDGHPGAAGSMVLACWLEEAYTCSAVTR
jgi:hypothetical protein